MVLLMVVGIFVAVSNVTAKKANAKGNAFDDCVDYCLEMGRKGYDWRWCIAHYCAPLL